MSTINDFLARPAMATLAAAKRQLQAAVNEISSAEQAAHAGDAVEMRRGLQGAFLAIRDAQSLADAADTLSRMTIHGIRRLP